MSGQTRRVVCKHMTAARLLLVERGEALAPAADPDPLAGPVVQTDRYSVLFPAEG